MDSRDPWDANHHGKTNQTFRENMREVSISTSCIYISHMATFLSKSRFGASEGVKNCLLFCMLEMAKDSFAWVDVDFLKGRNSDLRIFFGQRTFFGMFGVSLLMSSRKKSCIQIL